MIDVYVDQNISRQVMESFNSTQSMQPSFMEVCNLNQLDLLNQIQKLPVKLFYLVAGVAVCLVIYNWVLPNIRWDYRIEADSFFLQLALALSFFATILCASLVFQISTRGWMFIEAFMFVILLVGLGYRFYLYRKGVKDES